MERNFNKLEAMAMFIADTVHGPVQPEQKLKKLKEEFEELLNELPVHGKENGDLDKIKDEFGDLLFVTLHLSNYYGYSAFDLLHHAVNKSFNRFKDPQYGRRIV